MGAQAEGHAFDLTWVIWAAGEARNIGPVGPLRVTPAGVDRPPEMSYTRWWEFYVAAEILLRALLLRI